MSTDFGTFRFDIYSPLMTWRITYTSLFKLNSFLQSLFELTYLKCLVRIRYINKTYDSVLWWLYEIKTKGFIRMMNFRMFKPYDELEEIEAKGVCILPLSLSWLDFLPIILIYFLRIFRNIRNTGRVSFVSGTPQDEFCLKVSRYRVYVRFVDLKLLWFLVLVSPFTVPHPSSRGYV